VAVARGRDSAAELLRQIASFRERS
jgi:hypothetical protein